MKNAIRILVAAALVLAGTYVAIGGREGVLLAYLKHVQRTEPRPTRTIPWSNGPAVAPAPGAKRPPNIVVIVADDLGINDLSFAGGGVAGGAVRTPRIDSISKQGVTFENGYAGNATCTPSRAAMLTGRYGTRFGFEFTGIPKQFSKLVGGHVAPDSVRQPIYHDELAARLPHVAAMGMPTTEKTMATLLRQAGYRTLHLGKWHLGEEPRFQPNAHGFDESLAMMGGGGMYLHENDPAVVNAKLDFDPIDKFLWASHPWGLQYNGGPLFAPARYVTDYLTDEAIRAIDANKNRPFFMYLAYNAPHTPLQATKENYDALASIPDPKLRVYAAMIRSLDRNVGRVLDAVKAQGLDDDTLVVFTSDNGGQHYVGLPDLNKPYRGWKATFFEGGLRVPYFMCWPGTIAAGSVYREPVSHFDIFGTVLAAAGVAAPGDRKVDGVDLLPYVNGKAAGTPHGALFWRSGEYRAVRAGNWKLQTSRNPAKAWLFDLARDPTERHDLAASNPTKVAELRALLDAHDREQAPSLWPSLAEIPVAIDKTLAEPLRDGDEFIYWAI
jgi:arylsulfatase A-like enzyme